MHILAQLLEVGNFKRALAKELSKNNTFEKNEQKLFFKVLGFGGTVPK